MSDNTTHPNTDLLETRVYLRLLTMLCLIVILALCAKIQTALKRKQRTELQHHLEVSSRYSVWLEEALCYFQLPNRLVCGRAASS